MSKQAVPEADTRDARERRSREGQAAIRRLGAPVRTRLRVGQVLVLISGVLAVAPYIALVRLGGILSSWTPTTPAPPRTGSGCAVSSSCS